MPAGPWALTGSRRSKTVLSGRRPFASLFSTRQLVVAALIGASVFSARAAAMPVAEEKPAVSLADLPRIRTLDLDVALAVRRGYDASPTLRRIVQKLQSANVIVYLDRNNRFHQEEAAHLRFAGSARGLRYVRVSLSTRLTARELTVFVAHELMHALEIAEAEQVVDERSMKDLYCRIGSLTHNGYDTEAALRVTEQVSDELDSPGLRDR